MTRHCCFRRVPGLVICSFVLALTAQAIADERVPADEEALSRIFDPQVLAQNVRAMRSQAARIPPVERFEYLLNAILPKPGGETVRLAGEFTPTSPVPTPTTAPEQSVIPDSTTQGGDIAAPVFQLLDLGKELGRLEEIQKRVDSLPESSDDFQQRARVALRLLVTLELGNLPEADILADKLAGLVRASKASTIAAMWPELLVVYRALHRHRADQTVSDLLTAMLTHPSLGAATLELEIWKTHVTVLARLLYQHVSHTDWLPLSAENRDQSWRTVERPTARFRGSGSPRASWLVGDGQILHSGGHHLDLLLYRSPLLGNYEVECDLYAPEQTEGVVAGRILGLSGGGTNLIRGTIREGNSLVPVEPRWEAAREWVRFRAVVRDGMLTVFLDGRQAYIEPLSPQHDPWVGIHSYCQAGGRVRDILITGQPRIPQAVSISELPDLRGWFSYFHEIVVDEGAVWRWELDPATRRGQIIARRNDALTGTQGESLLNYIRPLGEDGSITYDFFYDPGKTTAAPALDRLAFLLDPTGVVEHWITDGRYETTAISPENASAFSTRQRGPRLLPLRLGDWNRLEMSIVGKTVALVLNETLIYERELEPDNSRRFGLFRRVDENLKVRYVELRGNWPTTVPPPAEQPAADPAIAVLDARLPQLLERFDHDFARDGLPSRVFQLPANKLTPEVTPAGVLHREQSNDDGWAYSVIKPTVEMHGDFDVMLQFVNFQTPSVNSGFGLGFFAVDKHLELIRRHRESPIERVYTTFVTPGSSGEKRHTGYDLITEALSGTFRIARRGDTLTTLFADHDSTAFRKIAEHTWEHCGQTPATLDIRAMAHNRGNMRVTWKRFQVAAERLMRLPDTTQNAKPVVFTINADGSNVKQVTRAEDKFVWHGSPEWSPDGQSIAYDAWTGNASTSRIFIMKADGSELTDLGPGIIPTFSPDGKRLAITVSGRGTTIMNVDGSGRETLTNEGWGTQWSPDGKWIVYGSYQQTPQGGGGGNLTMIDVVTKKKRILLEGDHAERYRNIEWNMAWSPDSRKIVFKAHGRNGSEIAIVSTEGSSHGFHVVTSDDFTGNFSWHPNGNRILMSKAGRFHEYEVETRRIQLLPGHPLEPAAGGGMWDHLGQRIVFIGVPKPESTPWNEPAHPPFR